MVSIFTEGPLDETVLRLIIERKMNLEVGVAVSGKGKSYLRSRSRALNRSAKGYPVIVLADQDSVEPCPPGLLEIWLDGDQLEQNFLLRFAALSIEAWLLADTHNISDFLKIPINKIPENVEAVTNPKQALVNLARSSKNSSVRDALVPHGASSASVGSGYNNLMTLFVSRHWDIDAAASNAASLRRAVARIEALAARMHL